MKYMKKTMKAALAAALAFSMIVTVSAGTAPAYTAAGTSQKEEVIYVTTDAEGTVKAINAVNIFDGGSITDYGNYAQVKMLTSEDKISKSGNQIKIDAGEERIYYQGTMKTKQIPWNISIRYYLDGKEYSPEKNAGKSGHLKIHFRVTKNNACSGDFFDNYSLQAAFTLDTEKCTNISAKDATVANVGQDKQLSYIVLPGKGIDTYITADVEDFEMDAVSINGVKLNLNIDVDYTKIDKKADDATDAVSKLDDGTGKVKDGAKKIDDASEEPKEKVAELDEGTGKINDGAGEFLDGLTQITGKNAELINGAYSAFVGICSASETVLNEQLTANGIGKVSLTPTTYSKVLNDLLETLDPAAVHQKAYSRAYRRVSQEVEQKQDELYYRAAMQAVKAQLLQQGMDEAAADEYLQTDQGKALVDGTAAGMSDEQKAQIKEAYIQQMMQSSAVTSQINEAVASAESSAKEIRSLKTQLDDYQKFYYGVCEYTLAVSDARDGASQLADGTNELNENVGLLSDAVSEFRGKMSKLYDGISELKDATEEFLDEISKLKGEVHDIVSDMIDELKGKGMLRSFVSEKNTEIESVQFVIKTDAVSAGDAAQQAETPEESLTFWQKLLRLFGMY